MSKTISFSLSESGIDSAIKALQEYKGEISRSSEDLVHQLSKTGADIAKDNVHRMDDRGTLGWVESAIDSETVERTGMRFIGGIVCHDEKAAFVEMGTGFIGAGHPHEIAVRLGWRYDINSHGAAGWWYPTTSSDPNPHKREIDGRLYAWTAGMPARPFMHDAYKNLKRDLKTTAKEVFAE